MLELDNSNRSRFKEVLPTHGPSVCLQQSRATLGTGEAEDPLERPFLAWERLEGSSRQCGREQTASEIDPLSL